MSTDKTRLEIGHVLFIDIVGYSKLLLKQQSELLRELNEVVSGTNEFRQAESAGKLIRLPTGDGMALVFRTNPEAPAAVRGGGYAGAENSSRDSAAYGDPQRPGQ